MSAASRDTFPLRFRNPRNREALRQLAELTGTSMTAIAERAIEHEVVLLAADLEHRLEQSLETVRSYQPERDLDAYIDAAAAGEQEGDLGFGMRAVQAVDVEARQQHAPAHSRPAQDVLTAFSRG